MATMRIGALSIGMSLDSGQFEAGMKRAQKTAAQTEGAFKKSFGNLGGVVKAGLAGVVSGLSVGLLVQGAKAALEYAGSLGEVSQQLGVTTKDLQVFRYAAGQLGVSQEQLETGLQKLTITLGQLKAGAEAPAKALDAVKKGLSDQVKAAGDAGEAFRIIADGLKNVTDRSQRAAVEVALFGKSGAKLDNLLSGGSAALNELADAAEKLGIVLSDEQIQKADDTADKLEALQTVLKAKIAGDVADNADSILDFADALFQLVNAAEQAREAIVNFQKNYNLPHLLFGKGEAFGKGVAGSSVTTDLSSGGSALALAKKMGLKVAGSGGGGGGSISQFLAPSGGSRARRGGSDDAERKRQEALRDAFQFDQELLRAQQDSLRAQQQLSTDYSERAAISIQLLNLDKQGFEREMQYAVASGDLSKVQAAQLQAEYDKRDALERTAVLKEEEEQRQRDYNMLDAKDADIKLDILEKQADLADTWQERRAIELKILDLAYEEERRRLTRITEESQDWAEIEAARRDLLALTKKQALDRQSVNRQTAGPFEQAQIQFGDLSEEMEQLKVQGIMGAADALTALTEGFGSFKDAAVSAIKQVIAEFIRLQTLKFLFNLIGGGIGGGVGATGTSAMSSAIGNMGLPGFATGGGFNVMGKGGVDNNLLSLNGLPIARVSHGERVSVSNDNARGGGSPVSISFAITGPVTRETQTQIAAAARRGIAQANRKGV